MTFRQWLFLLHEELRKSGYFTDVLFTFDSEKKCLPFKFCSKDVHFQQFDKRSSEEFYKSLRDYIEKYISKSWEILPYNEFGVVWHKIMLKLDEVNSVFIFAKKNSFNVHLCSASCIKTLHDANFDLQNG